MVTLAVDSTTVKDLQWHPPVCHFLSSMTQIWSTDTSIVGQQENKTGKMNPGTWRQ